MTSLQRDPRKQYVLDKRNCKDLSITQKLYHPECRKEATVERPINPKPKPQPKPPPVPPVPPTYSFKIGDYPFDYQAGYDYNPIFTGATTGALAGVAVQEAIRYARATPEREGYSRVAQEDPDRPSVRRLSGRARVSDIKEEIELGGLRSRAGGGLRTTSLDTPSSGGLRFRGRGLDDTTFTNMEEGVEMDDFRDVPLEPEPLRLPTTRMPLQSRIPFMSQLPRATPPRIAPPSSTTQLTTTSQSATELTESQARAKQLSTDLDNLINTAKTEQAGISEAEQKLTTAESMSNANIQAGQTTQEIDELQTADVQAQAEGELAQAEGEVPDDDGAGIGVRAGDDDGRGGVGDDAPDTSGIDLAEPDDAGGAVASGAEAGAESALKDPETFSRPTALIGGLVVGAGVGAGVGAISQAITSAVDKGKPTENLAEREQRETNNEKISSIITNQITNPMNYNPASIASNIITGIFAGTRKAQTFLGIPNTGVMNPDQITSTLNNINDKLKTATAGSSDYNQLSALKSAITTTQKNGGAVVSYTNAQGQSELGMTITKPQLATAIKVYQQNPNAFKGVSPTKLQIMGLNPDMSLGEEGAVKTSIGYIPKTRASDGATWSQGAGGGNWTQFYVGTKEKSPFNSNDEITQLAVPDSQQKSILNDNYISQVDTIISAQTNPQAKAYIQYQLDLFKYSIGYLPTKPKPVAKPPAFPESELTQLQNNLAREKAGLQATQSSITTKQSLINSLDNQQSTPQQTTTPPQDTQQQISSYRLQAMNYNKEQAMNTDIDAGRTEANNIMYARATNTPLLAPTGKYLTTSQLQGFQNQLKTGQITTKGVSPIKTLAPVGITTSATGSPIINQNALKSVPPPKAVPAN